MDSYSATFWIWIHFGSVFSNLVGPDPYFAYTFLDLDPNNKTRQKTRMTYHEKYEYHLHTEHSSFAIIRYIFYSKRLFSSYKNLLSFSSFIALKKYLKTFPPWHRLEKRLKKLFCSFYSRVAVKIF